MVPQEGFEGKAEILVELENLKAINDSAVICKSAKAHVTKVCLAQLFDVDYETLLETGGRIVELERHFNNHRGFDRTDDRLPYDIEGLKDALDEYYAHRGWSENGVIPESALSD